MMGLLIENRLDKSTNKDLKDLKIEKMPRISHTDLCNSSGNRNSNCVVRERYPYSISSR